MDAADLAGLLAPLLAPCGGDSQGRIQPKCLSAKAFWGERSYRAAARAGEPCWVLGLADATLPARDRG